MKAKGVDCVYSCPDRKESAAHAERSCGIVEVVIKSMLFQSNLPPSWWQHAASMAEWMLDRFPVTSQSVSVPMMVIERDHWSFTLRILTVQLATHVGRLTVNFLISLGLAHRVLSKPRPRAVLLSQRPDGVFALECTAKVVYSGAPTQR